MTANTGRARIKKGLGFAAATLALSGGMVVAVAGPAAAAGNGVCSNGEVCLWQEYEGGGSTAEFTGEDDDYANDRFINGDKLNDAVSSIRNRGNTSWIRMYTNRNQAGNDWEYPNNDTRYNITTVDGIQYNNKFSSHRWFQK